MMGSGGGEVKKNAWMNGQGRGKEEGEGGEGWEKGFLLIVLLL